MEEQSLFGPIKDITTASNSNADLHVFLCNDETGGPDDPDSVRDSMYH